MLNKKGFTIAEVIVSFSMISIILASMVSFTITYRDKLKNEEVISQLLDFKNTVTKVVYDDIISNNYIRMEKCLGSSNCVNFIDYDNNAHTLEVVELNDTRKGVYLSYNGIKYMLPDSDIKEGNSYLCNFDGQFELKTYENPVMNSAASNFYGDSLEKVYPSKLFLDTYNGELNKNYNLKKMANYGGYDLNKIYSLKITFHHYGLNRSFDILLTLTPYF